MEYRLSELWKASIRLQDHLLRPEDNYFALGNDSLAAMRSVSCARDVGLNLSVHIIFAHLTLEDVALRDTMIQQDKPHISSDYRPFELVRDSDLAGLKATLKSSSDIESRDILDVLPISPLQRH